jgi:tetratricopeptide (TPR) repeat protein
MRRTALVLALGCLACASLPIRPQDAAALAEADRQVLAGCYDCLLAARTLYERVGVGRARPLVINRLFEVQVLIALRELELALDWEPARRQAALLAAELPRAAQAGGETAPRPIDGMRVLALVDLVPPESYGWPVATALAHRERIGNVPNLEGELAWLDSSGVAAAFAAYLRLSIECSSTAALIRAPRRALVPKPELPADAPPLVKYRHALCSGIAETPLRALRTAIPEFVEVGGHLGRLAVPAIERTGEVAAAHADIQAFHARFPASAAATYLYGTFHQTVGDCDAALSFYEETLARRPGHEQALLARTLCLSHLSRHETAISAATQVIGRPSADRMEGFYWRAWNRWMLKLLPDARADIDQAKRLRRSTAVLTLAGAIELDQDDLEIAEADLKRAISLSGRGTNCEAHWYLGHVLDRRASIEAGAVEYESAMDCYAARQLAAESQKQLLAAHETADPGFKMRKRAALDARILESATQRAASAYNGARLVLRLGDLSRARRLIDVAAADSSIADAVAQLRKYLDRHP